MGNVYSVPLNRTPVREALSSLSSVHLDDPAAQQLLDYAAGRLRAGLAEIAGTRKTLRRKPLTDAITALDTLAGLLHVQRCACPPAIPDAACTLERELVRVRKLSVLRSHA